MNKVDWRIISLFADAEGAVIHTCEERGWPISYGKDESILWEGDDCQKVYFITSGLVEVYRTAVDGREHTLRILRSGDSFNLVPALLKDGKHFANVRCLQQTGLLLIGKDDFKKILIEYPKFSLSVLQELAGRLASMTGAVGDLALNSVRQRTAAFLMRAADDQSNSQGQHWTQDDMARQIGTVRDVVGRTLKDFEEKGLIKRNRGDIRLINREGLGRAAKGLE